MFEKLIEATALPNLHPAIVHFPIVCLPLALAFEAGGLMLRRQRWLAPAATTLYTVGVLTAWLAVWAGERAADGLIGVPAAVQPRIGEHSDWAHYAFYAWIGLAAARLFVHLKPGLKDHRGMRLLVLALGLALLGVLGKAADLGGGLVYEHGLAVKSSITETSETHSHKTDPPMANEEPPNAAMGTGMDRTAMDRLVEREDGALAWQPAPGDVGALGTLLTAAPGSEVEAVRALEPEGDGLRFAIDRPTTLLLPGTFGDVQVEAEIELLGYKGSVGLVHHYLDSGDGGAFSLSNQGDAVLDDVYEGERKVLDRKQTEVPTGPIVLAVSVSGKHLKGLVDGKTVTHGHIASRPEGSCGLRLDGSGNLRIVRIVIQPLEQH